MPLSKIKLTRELILLFCILALGLFLRVYRLAYSVGFDFDQEYAATFAQNVLQVYPIQLIGQGLSVQGLFMGPLYFYFLVPFFFMTSLHPIGGYIASVILGLFIIATYYFVGKRAFGTSAGLIGAFLRAILFVKIQGDWSMAPSYSSELALLFTFFCIYKYWHKDYRYLLPLGFIFGMYTSFHPIQFPFYLVFLYIFLVKRNIPHIKYIVGSIALFILPLTPLILFEYFHDFLEIKLLFSLDSTSAATKKTLGTLVEYSSFLFQTPLALLGIKLAGIAGQVATGALLVGGGFFAMKRVSFWKDSFHVHFLLGTIGLFLAYYYILPTHAPGYYFLGVETVMLIYFAATLSLLAKRAKGVLVVSLLLLLITVVNIQELFKVWNRPDAASLGDKEAIIKEIRRRQPDNRMTIEQDIEFGHHYGFGYLTRLYKLDPQGGGPIYTIVLPIARAKEAVTFSSGNIGLIVKD